MKYLQELFEIAANDFGLSNILALEEGASLLGLSQT
jgi:hypothetical protein